MLGAMVYTKEYGQSGNNNKIVGRARRAQIMCYNLLRGKKSAF